MKIALALITNFGTVFFATLGLQHSIKDASLAGLVSAGSFLVDKIKKTEDSIKN